MASSVRSRSSKKDTTTTIEYDDVSDGEFNDKDVLINDVANDAEFMTINGKTAQYLVDDMNDMHKDWLEAYVRHNCRQGKSEIKNVEMIGINEDLFKLQWSMAEGVQQSDIKFSPPLNGRGDAKTKLTALAEIAMQELGMGEPGHFENGFLGQFMWCHPAAILSINLAMLWITTFAVFQWLPTQAFQNVTIKLAGALRDALFMGQLGMSELDFLRWVVGAAWVAHAVEALYALHICLQHRWEEDIFKWVFATFMTGFPQLTLLIGEARIVEDRLRRSQTRHNSKNPSKKHQ